MRGERALNNNGTFWHCRVATVSVPKGVSVNSMSGLFAAFCFTLVTSVSVMAQESKPAEELKSSPPAEMEMDKMHKMHGMNGMMKDCMAKHKNGKGCDHMMKKCEKKMGKEECQKMMKEHHSEMESSEKE